ncbi:homoserine dehydrogenase [bacterium]|nr:homoserine dehydrogenase [bacterium]
MSEHPIRVGLVGLGQVGSAVAQRLLRDRELIALRSLHPIELKRVAVNDLNKTRSIDLSGIRLDDQALQLASDPEVDLVVELVGGTGVAREVVLTALRNGKHVVTANKALLAEHGDEVFPLALKMGRQLGLEASVGGGIPIIQTLDGAMVASEITEIFTIINGTSNYILTELSEGRNDYKGALSDAKRLGYAESDPTFDVEGYDSAHKIAILASVCFGTQILAKEVRVEGITRLTPADFEHAHELRHEIKLLAIAKDFGDEVEVRVHPTMIPIAHPLASVRGVDNGILLVSSDGIKTGLYGQGAGPIPTSAAVVSDIIAIARRFDQPVRSHFFGHWGIRPKRVRSWEESHSRYCLRAEVLDKPGVLAKIFKILADYNISISAMVSRDGTPEVAVPTSLTLHPTREGALKRALEEINQLEVVVKDTPFFIRIEEMI